MSQSANSATKDPPECNESKMHRHFSKFGLDFTIQIHIAVSQIHKNLYGLLTELLPIQMGSNTHPTIRITRKSKRTVSLHILRCHWWHDLFQIPFWILFSLPPLPQEPFLPLWCSHWLIPAAKASVLRPVTNLSWLGSFTEGGGGE